MDMEGAKRIIFISFERIEHVEQRDGIDPARQADRETFPAQIKIT